MNKKQLLCHLEMLLHRAIAEGNLVYSFSTPQVVVHYEGCRMLINTSFDCLYRTYRRVGRPSSNTKLLCGKRLLNAVEKFSE